MDDDTFRVLLERFCLSWPGYLRVRKGVKKRLVRHIQKLGCQNTDEYFRALDNPDILKEAVYLMTVSISSFFRNQLLWQMMEEKIFPEIIERKNKIINIWSAGCALGQEVYSVKMLWDMMKDRFDNLPSLHIRATDMNPDYIERAKAGVYPAKRIYFLSKAEEARYFNSIAGKANISVVDFLKEGILWETHDLIKEPPLPEKYQIIFLRNNLLTYYCQSIKEQTLKKISGCLESGGFLIIGHRELLPMPLPELSPFSGCPYIFQVK